MTRSSPMDDQSRWLSEPESLDLLAEYKLPVVPHRLATSAEDASQAARELGFPVALKIVAPGLIHKSDIGGVLLGIPTAAAAADAFSTLSDRVRQHTPHSGPDGILVAKMAAPGTEVIVGMARDPQFGPAIMCGLGGVFVELYKDVVFRLPPVSLEEARAMLTEVKAAPLLTGYRGQPPRDLDAVAVCVCAVARIADAHPAIQEIDLNPIIAHERGCTIVDAKIRVGS